MIFGTSLVVQWLGFCAPTAGDTGSIPGRGTKILHAVWHSPPKKTTYFFYNKSQKLHEGWGG